MTDAIWAHVLIPQNILFAIAFIISLFQFHIRPRRKMLATKFVSDAFYCSYYLTMGAPSGAMGSAIAGTGGLIQAITPDHLMRKTHKYRIFGAIILSCLGIYVTGHEFTNILPLVAVIIARCFELSSSPQRIRFGISITFPLWITYNLMNGLYLIVLSNLIVFASLIWAIWKHHRIKLSPEPV
jgi:hypothetical protein